MRKDTLKHIVKCTNCGKDVLDHMTACPFCKNSLDSKYSLNLSKDKLKKIKAITNIIGFIIALIVLFIVFKTK